MTTNSEITGVYARALFDLAIAADAVDPVGAGLAGIDEAARANRELADVLGDATIPAAKKVSILGELFAGVAPEAIAIALVCLERSGVAALGKLVAEYDAIAQAERNVVVADVTTAAPLSEEARAMVSEKLAANIGKPVVLRERVDTSILGGIRIRVAGRVLDGSLSKQLTSIRAALTNSTAGGEA